MHLACAHCGAPIPTSPISTRLPYWCPRCGNDLKTREVEVAPVVADALANPVPLEIAALPPDYSKKWAAAQPQPSKPAAPPPVVTEVFTNEPTESAPAPTPQAAAPTPTPAVLESQKAPNVPKLAPPPSAGPQSFAHHQLALLIMTALFLALSGFLAIRSLNMALAYRQTNGKVIGFEQVQTRHRTGVSTATYPVVSYQVGGKTYKTMGTNSTGPVYGYYQVGQPVKVRYLPSDPSTGGLDSFNERWLGSIITGVLGFAALAGWLVLRFWNKIRPLLKRMPVPASLIPSTTP
jgi:hypothetical protein